MKKCSRCKENKELDQFCKSKQSKDGYKPWCRNCTKLYNINNKEKYKISQNKFKNKHPNYNIEQYERIKEWNLNNKDKVKLTNQKYNNSEKGKQRRKDWNLNNKDKIKETNKKWSYNKYNNDINYKLNHILRVRLRCSLKNIQTSKSILKLTNCSLEQLKQHLESMFKPEMSWSNWGKVWEIDHIIGCCNFNLTDVEQQRICFHYTNLRPLFKTTIIAESFGYNDQIGNRNRSKK